MAQDTQNKTIAQEELQWFYRTSAYGLFFALMSLIGYVLIYSQDLVLKEDTPTKQTQEYVIRQLDRLPNRNIIDYVEERLKHYNQQWNHEQEISKREIEEIHQLLKQLQRDLQQRERYYRKNKSS